MVLYAGLIVAIPKLPWYNKLRSVVAPTEPITNMVLVILIVISIGILLWGDELIKAGWVVYLVSP